MHVADTHTQSMVIAEVVFNPNSIQFLNRHNGSDCSVVANELAMRLGQTSAMPSLNLFPKTIMVDSGSVMSFFGLRPRTDVEILFSSNVKHQVLGLKNGISMEQHTFTTTNRGSKKWVWGERNWCDEHLVGQTKCSSY